MTRHEHKAAKEVADALYDKLTESLPDVISDIMDGDVVMDKIINPDEKHEDFYAQFEALVFQNVIRLLGGKVK